MLEASFIEWGHAKLVSLCKWHGPHFITLFLLFPQYKCTWQMMALMWHFRHSAPALGQFSGWYDGRVSGICCCCWGFFFSPLLYSLEGMCPYVFIIGWILNGSSVCAPCGNCNLTPSWHRDWCVVGWLLKVRPCCLCGHSWALELYRE